MQEDHSMVKKISLRSPCGGYMFQPIELVTLGAINSPAGEFLADLGRKISGVSGETREWSFLFQRLSIVLLRYNAILLHESFYEGDKPNK